ncbi:hypothetical protein PMAYCL1PPCAC_24709, partial [Pristionchus mayeri]
RFVLALENKICTDYITEKAFRYKKLIVPIVFSRRIAEVLLPSDSFIAIDDYNSISQMKEHLERLMKNDEYFAWLGRKDDREVKRRGIRKLCTDLHESLRSHHSSLSLAAFPDANACVRADSGW